MTLCWMLLAAAAAAPDVNGVLARLETAGRALKTMKADFVETRVNVVLNETEQMSGTVTLQIPGRFRYDYVKPQPSVVMVKDGRFSRYVPQSKQVFRGEAHGEADLLVGFGPGAANLGGKYDVTLLPDEAVGGAPAHVLDLKPKGEQAKSGLFAAIRLWVDAKRDIPVQTRLTEPTGDHTTIRFDNVVVNAKLTDKAFDLALPRDVVEVK